MNVDSSDWNRWYRSLDTDGDDTVSDAEWDAGIEPYGGTLKGLVTGPGRNKDIRGCGAMGASGGCFELVHTPAVSASAVDPSYFRMGIGYTFGGTTVAASWYNSEDFVMKGSEGTALGIGASHTLPKVGATVHASVQNYEVKRPGMVDMDETVIQIGTLVTF